MRTPTCAIRAEAARSKRRRRSHFRLRMRATSAAPILKARVAFQPKAGLFPVRRHVDHALADSLAGMAECDRAPIHLYPADDRHDAAQHLQSRRCAGTFETRKADDLPGANRQGQIRDAARRAANGDRDGAPASHSPAGRGSLVGEAAHHGARDGRNVGICGLPAPFHAAVP